MADETLNGADGAASSSGTAQLTIQKIYIKDASFEAPGAPQVFADQGQPQLQLNLSQKVTNVAENAYEVVLTITVTCTINEKTAYLAEVQQAGLFGLSGFEPRGLEAVLSTYCPNTLFPYARQTVSDLVQNGGFPPLFLQPINFDQLYADQVRRRAGQAEQGGEGADAIAGNA
jgi:preprotein translocase subunit SecB